MTAAAIVVSVAIVCVTLVVLQRGHVPPIDVPAPSLLDGRLRERVVVTLKSGEAFAGVLFDADDRVWVLRNAEAVGAADDRSNVDVDGEVVLSAANIAFAQRP